jgi:hypothetical protein
MMQITVDLNQLAEKYVSNPVIYVALNTISAGFIHSSF